MNTRLYKLLTYYPSTLQRHQMRHETGFVKFHTFSIVKGVSRFLAQQSKWMLPRQVLEILGPMRANTSLCAAVLELMTPLSLTLLGKSVDKGNYQGYVDTDEACIMKHLGICCFSTDLLEPNTHSKYFSTLYIHLHHLAIFEPRQVELLREKVAKYGIQVEFLYRAWIMRRIWATPSRTLP